MMVDILVVNALPQLILRPVDWTQVLAAVTAIINHRKLRGLRKMHRRIHSERAASGVPEATRMRYMLVVALILIGTSFASADELLVEACKRATMHWQMDKKLNVDMVQDFSNLKPPHVRMLLAGRISSMVSCTFSSTTKPVGLVEYCTELQCYKAGEKRFDEVSALMRRDGY